MKYLILIILTLSFSFSNELTVDGDLTVTGNIQSQTIDSLQQVIADLQAQLNGLQVTDRMETRIITLHISLTPGSNGEDFYVINPQEIFGIDIEYALVSILDVKLINGTEGSHITLNHPNNTISVGDLSSDGSFILYSDDDLGIGPLLYNPNMDGIENFRFYCGQPITFNATLSVTAQFPNSSTQLRKTNSQNNNKQSTK